jgi:hypothetical protein
MRLSLQSSRLVMVSFPYLRIHICRVKPSVSEELQFNQQVCDVEAKHTLYTREMPREYCRTSVVPTQSARIRTGVNALMSRAVFETDKRDT